MFLLPPSAMWRGGPHPPAGGGTGQVALTCLLCWLEAVSLVIITGSFRVRLVVVWVLLFSMGHQRWSIDREWSFPRERVSWSSFGTKARTEALHVG